MTGISPRLQKSVIDRPSLFVTYCLAPLHSRLVTQSASYLPIRMPAWPDHTSVLVTSTLLMQDNEVFCLDEVEVHAFSLFLRLYTFDPEQLTFRPVPRMPRHLPHQIGKALHALHLIETAGQLMRAV